MSDRPRPPINPRLLKAAVAAGTARPAARPPVAAQPKPGSATVAVAAEDVAPLSPVWDPDLESLVWTDPEQACVFRFKPGGAREIIQRQLAVNGIAMGQSNELIFATPNGLHVQRAGGECAAITATLGGPAHRFQCAVADRKGRVYAATAYWDENGMRDLGKIYLVAGVDSVQPVDDKVELLTAMALSPDDKLLYCTDASTRRIVAYDVDPESGALANKRVLATIPATDGVPSGLAVDAEGAMWVAVWYSGSVVRFDPAGKILQRIAMPALQVSGVAFGGKDLADLYVTSAAANWMTPFAPSGYNFAAPNRGGSLYRLQPGVRGKPLHRAILAGL